MLTTFAALVFSSYFQPDDQAVTGKGSGDQALIRTVVGDANRGDGLAATQAIFLDASAVAVDSADNLYVVDRFDHRIRRIDAASGVISTVAGTGEQGFSGDGGPALAARLSFPGQLVFDQDDNLYLADPGNKRIRRIDGETGIITTVAGNGDFGSGGDGGPATEAQLGQPLGVALDRAGVLYIADRGTHSVRRVDLVTGVISRFAGSGNQGFTGDGLRAVNSGLSDPEGVVVDAGGRVLIADSGNHRVRVVDPVSGLIDTVAGGGSFGFGGDGGPAHQARLFLPSRLALDHDGSLLIADLGNFRVRKISAETGFITTAAGSGASGSAGDGGIATEAAITPFDLAVGQDGSLIIAQGPEKTVRSVSPDGLTVTTIAGGLGFDNAAVCTASLAAGVLGRVGGVSVDDNGVVYVADPETHTVSAIDILAGTMTILVGQRGQRGFGGDGGPGASALLNAPVDVAVAEGSLFIADTGNARIRRYDLASGAVETWAGSGQTLSMGDGGPANAAGFAALGAIEAINGGRVYAIDGNRVRVIGTNAESINTLAGSDAAGFSGDGGRGIDALLNAPRDLAFDPEPTLGSVAGQPAHAPTLLIADTGNHRIRRLHLGSNTISTVAGGTVSLQPMDDGPATAASLLRPSGLAVTESSDLIIADTLHQRLRRVDRATGTIETLAGNGVGGLSGDNGPALAAMILNPERLAVGPRGRVYAVDQAGARLRVIETQGASLNLPIDITTGDRFGDAVAASGNALAVAAPEADGGGSVLIYRFDGCRVLLEDRIAPPPDVAVAAFGRSLALSSDLLVVGADANPAGKGLAALQAAIYERTQQSWQFKQALTDPDDAGGDFGNAVAIQGTDILVAATGSDASQAGAVHVFDDDGALMTTLRPDDGAASFGTALATTDSAIAVGSPGTQSVQVFTKAGGQLGPSQSFSRSTPGFGAAVAMKGSILGIGAPGSGQAFLIDTALANAVTQSLQAAQQGASDAFGTAIAISDDIVAVGDPDANAASGGSGAVFAFPVDPGSRKFDAKGTVDKREAAFYQSGLGVALAISENLLVAGAPTTAASRGDAAVIRFADAPPPQIGSNHQIQTELAVDPARACPGFYIARATAVGSGQSSSEGRWSMEVLLQSERPLLQGGLNLGGGFAGSSQPGFAAFNIANPRNEAQQVSGDITVDAAPGVRYQIEILRRESGQSTIVFSDEHSEPTASFSLSLDPGFYTARIFSSNGETGLFSMALATTIPGRGAAFQGGVNLGGLMMPSSLPDSATGFAAFCVAETQSTRITSFGADAFGAAGVESLRLDLLDRDRNVIATSP